MDDLPVSDVDRHMADAVLMGCGIEQEVSRTVVLLFDVHAFHGLRPGIPGKLDPVLPKDRPGKGRAVNAGHEGSPAEDVFAAVILERRIDDVAPQLRRPVGVREGDCLLQPVGCPDGFAGDVAAQVFRDFDFDPVVVFPEDVEIIAFDDVDDEDEEGDEE